MNDSMNKSFTTNLDYKKNRKFDYGLLFVFLVWPFAGLVTALSKYKERSSRIIVFLFLVLYGATLIISSQGSDAYRYSQNLLFTAHLPFNSFWDIVTGIYAKETSVDIIGPFITFIVSRFTSQPQIFFAIIAAVFGIFYLKSINFIYDRYFKKRNRNVLIYSIFLASLIPIFNINGYRFWTASWIFIFGVYHILIIGDKRYFIICLLASFMHFSFISANAVLLIYLFLGNKNSIYITVLVLSFILPNLLAAYIPKIAGLIGEGVLNRAHSYTNEVYKTQIAETTAGLKWFMTTKILYYYLLGVLFYSQLKMKKLVDIPEMRNLFSFTLLFLSFANFLESTPSGKRFFTLYYVFSTTYLIILFYRYNKPKMHWITWVGIFPMLVSTIVAFRIGMNSLNAWLFTVTPIPFVASPISVASIFFK
jgi:hypothetical protein